MKENKKQKIREGLADLAAKAEQDHEVQMARSELYKLSKYSIKLHDLLKSVSETEGLQAWQQSYITKAADYIDAVYHDLSYEKSMGSEISADIGKSQADAIAAESRVYYADLYQKLAEEMRHTQDPSGVAYYKIQKKPKDDDLVRVLVGFSPERLSSRNAEFVSGDVNDQNSAQIKREIERAKNQLNVAKMVDITGK